MRSLFIFPAMPFCFEFCIFYLNVGGVHQHNFSNFFGCRSAVNRATATIMYKFGKHTAMIQTGMGQQDSINETGRYREFSPVTLTILPFLVQTTVNQYLFSVGPDKIARPCPVLCRNQK